MKFSTIIGFAAVAMAVATPAFAAKEPVAVYQLSEKNGGFLLKPKGGSQAAAAVYTSQFTKGARISHFQKDGQEIFSVRFYFLFLCYLFFFSTYEEGGFFFFLFCLFSRHQTILTLFCYFSSSLCFFQKPLFRCSDVPFFSTRTQSTIVNQGKDWQLKDKRTNNVETFERLRSPGGIAVDQHVFCKSTHVSSPHKP